MDIFQKVQRIIAEYLGIKPEDISPDTPLFQACRVAYLSSGLPLDTYIDFGAKRKKINIFNVLEIVLILEEEFGISIPDAEVNWGLATVKELVESISAKVAIL